MRPPKYRTVPDVILPIYDHTDTIVVGVQLRASVIAHGHVVTKEHTYRFPEDKQMTHAEAQDMSIFSARVLEAQEATGLFAQAEAEMDEWMIANGHEVPA